MRSRRNFKAAGLSLSLALSTLTLSPTVLAQGNEDAADEAPPSDAGDTSATSKDAAASDAAPTTNPEAAAGEQVEPAKEPAIAPADAPIPAKQAVQRDAEESISVKILPGSGYPAPRVRGIKGGSLWLTIPGHQWPYLPKVEGQSGLQIAVSGSAWADTSYARFESGRPEVDKSTKRWLSQGRGVLRISPAYSTSQGFFTQANVELVGNMEQTVNGSVYDTVDDMYVRVGMWNVFDVTVGRFQGWEIYHYGMGLDLNTFERRGAETVLTKAPQIYGVSTYWDRPYAGASNYAAHVYITDYLRGEVLTRFGTPGGGSNQYASRFTGIFDVGYFKAKVGYEYGVGKAQADADKFRSRTNGFGGALQFVLDPYIEGGVNAAVGYVDNVNQFELLDEATSTTTKSFGGFLNGRPFGDLLLGVGVNFTRFNTLVTNGIPGSPNFGKSNENDHLQAFFAVQYSLWDRVFFKFVGGRASYHFEDYVQEPAHPFTNTMYSTRFRVMYLF